jgi:hypothetical protein
MNGAGMVNAEIFQRDGALQEDFNFCFARNFITASSLFTLSYK